MTGLLPVGEIGEAAVWTEEERRRPAPSTARRKTAAGASRSRFDDNPAGVALMAGSAGVVALLLGGGLGVGLWHAASRVGSSRKHVTSTSATSARRRVDLPSGPPTFPL